MDTREQSECCTDDPCTSGLRNNYFRGKKLTRNSYSVEQRYHIERRKLLNRAIHGFGVVYGFPLSRIADGQLEVGAGVALDVPGRELIQVGSVKLAVDQLIPLDPNGERVKFGREHGWDDRGMAWQDSHHGCWLLSVHFAERPIAPVDVTDPCSCARKEWDQVCETVRYSLKPLKSCHECCKPEPCGLSCLCKEGPCCKHSHRVSTQHPMHPEVEALNEPGTTPRLVDQEEHAGAIQLAGRLGDGHFVNVGPHEPAKPVDVPPDRLPRGGCRCLCDHLTHLEMPTPCETSCWIDEPCGRVRVDLKNGVPLACVRLVYDDCKWQLTEIYDDCGPRRLVKRNDLLFDLIRGCDLTRIETVGWSRWHRKTMSFGDFQRSFGNPHGDRSLTAVYWIRFSSPVLRNTVRADCFDITLVVADHPSGWGKPRRVPIVDVYSPGTGELIQQAWVVVDGYWAAQLQGPQTLFTRCSEIHVEIRVHGDYIIDCNGQRIDGSVPGLDAQPTGRVKSGGDLFSSFAVATHSPDQRRDYYKRQPFVQGA